MRTRLHVLIGAGLAAAVSLAPPAAAAAAASPGAATVATTTTLSSSVASSSYDSRVMFTAHVTAASGTPTGSVTFTDESNGSVLDSVALSKGTATFATAALAPGTRHVVAHYGGSGTFAASSSAALFLPVARAGSDAVAYQINTRHSGRQATGALRAGSLTKKWSVTLGGAGAGFVEAGDVSYPVIARGRVFVTVEHTDTSGTTLYALDAATGATDWSVGLGGTFGFSALAYDGRRVFALNYDGVLTAFVAATGHQLWSVQMPVQAGATPSFDAPPTGYDGIVYVSGVGTVYAVSEAGGIVQWTGSVDGGDKSSPAVDGSGVYVSYACQQDYRFSLRGHLVWQHVGGCGGGGGSTAVLHGTSLYARGFRPLSTPIILAKSSGDQVGTFPSGTAPAFDGTNMYTLQGGDLVAADPSGGPSRWTYFDGTFVTAPVVNNGVVYVGSSTGTVYGVSVQSHTKIWSATAGSAIVGPDEQNADVLIGMAIGGGLLVVPAANMLTAFGN
jgi:outer membrane protein assembly factor BamB